MLKSNKKFMGNERMLTKNNVVRHFQNLGKNGVTLHSICRIAQELKV